MSILHEREDINNPYSSEYQSIARIPSQLLVMLLKINQILWIKPRIYSQQLVSQLLNSLYQQITDEYNLFFFLALFLSLIYIILGIKAAKQIANNTFGFDENGIVATYKSRRYWISKTIQLISGQFLFVMKSYIDAFICDYSIYPYTLIRQPSVECMSDLHFMYVALAIFGCIIYYPLSSYLQPTFQYMDHSLDLKYKSNYAVLYIQAKLLVLGMSTVFSNLQEQAYLYQMLFSSIVILILIYFHIKIQPCYVKWFNKIELCILSFLLYMYFGAFLILTTGLKIIGWLILGCFGGITLIFTIIQLIRYYNKVQLIQSTKVQPIIEATEQSQIMKK